MVLDVSIVEVYCVSGNLKLKFVKFANKYVCGVSLRGQNRCWFQPVLVINLVDVARQGYLNCKVMTRCGTPWGLKLGAIAVH